MEVHFLNVGDGDCSIIEHDSGRISMIDICCGNASCHNVDFCENATSKTASVTVNHVRGNFMQDNHPEDPVCWLEEELIRKKEQNFFRFILTHPDMDHMDGIKRLFQNRKPFVFWDTDNDEKKTFDTMTGHYRKDGWDFYQRLHGAENGINGTQVLRLFAGSQGQFYNRDENGLGCGDRMTILSPAKHTTSEANKSGKVNDLSYVLLVENKYNRKIVFAGDSEKLAWDYILEEHGDELENVDVLFAPHHGRKSGGNDVYLSVLKPKVTFFGNAPSEDLDYSAFRRKGLQKFTSKQIGSAVIMDDGPLLNIYCTNRTFPAKFNNKLEADVKPHHEKRGGKDIFWLTEIW